MSSPIRTENRAWSQVRVPTEREGLTRVEFRFDPEYLRRIAALDASAVPLLNTRGVDHARAREITLLDDVVKLDGGLLYVFAWLVPSQKIARSYHLRVKLIAPMVIRQAVNVIVAWDEVEFSLHLRAGSTESEDITSDDCLVHDENLPLSNLRLYVEHQGKTTRRPSRRR